MSTPEGKRSRWALWLPLGLFAAFVVLVIVGLYRPDDHVVASKMIGRPLPQFTLPAAAADRPGLSSRDFAEGKPRLLRFGIGYGTEERARGSFSWHHLNLFGTAQHFEADASASFLSHTLNVY
jgi:hypothetical protein